MNYELRMKNNYLFLTTIFLVFIDQFSKYLIRSQGGFYICNQGMAFGIKIPSYIYWIFVITLAAFFISPFVKGGLRGIFKIQNFYKNHLIHNSLFIILIIAGAISNIIDRLRFGCVIDFIDLKYWPVFNLADVFITLGAILLIVYYFKKNKKD